MSNLEYDSDVEREAVMIVKARRGTVKPIDTTVSPVLPSISKTDEKARAKHDLAVQKDHERQLREDEKDEKEILRKVDMLVKEKLEVEKIKLEERKLAKKLIPRTEAQKAHVLKMREKLKEKRDEDIRLKEEVKLEYEEIAKRVKTKLDKKKVTKEVKKKIKQLATEDISSDEEPVQKPTKPQPQPVYKKPTVNFF